MLTHWSVRYKLMAGFGICVVLLLSLGIIFYRRTEELSATARALVNAQESILHLKMLEHSLHLTGKKSPAINSSVTASIIGQDNALMINQELDRLMALAEGESAQFERLLRLRELVRMHLGTKNAAVSNLTNDELYSQINLLITEEYALLHMYQENLAYGVDSNRISLALGTFGCALLVGGVAGLIHRDLSRSVQLLVQASRQVGQGDYSFRLEVKGSDELSTVAEAYNRMAAQVQDERQRLLDTQADLKVLNVSLEQRAAELLQRGQEVQQLQQLMELLQSSASLEEALKLLGPRLSRLLPGSSGALYFLNRVHSLLELSGSWGKSGLVEPTFILEDCWALRRAKGHVVPPEQPELRCGHWRPGCEGWMSCAPLLAHGEVLGVISLSYESSPDESVNIFLHSIYEQLSLALANLRLRDRLREQSIRDPLTGLYNRRFLEESLQREVARAQRRSQALAVVMLDIDHFKTFNDQYGHEAGDLVLQGMATYLQAAVRTEDVVCRFGGEEFCLLWPGMREPDLSLRLEQLRCGIEEVSIVFQGDRLRVTASFGAAVYPDHAQEGSRLLLLADQALYDAKHAGRNTFCVTQLVLQTEA